MAWIKMISMAEATGALKAMYQKYIGPAGGVDNILKFSRQYANNNHLLAFGLRFKKGGA